MARRSIFDGAGYLIVDNRASDWGTKEEADMLGCNHCHGLMKKSDWKEDGAFCHHCGSPICTHCADIPGCTPFEQKLERAINAHHTRQQNARILGI